MVEVHLPGRVGSVGAGPISALKFQEGIRKGGWRTSYYAQKSGKEADQSLTYGLRIRETETAKLYIRRAVRAAGRSGISYDGDWLRRCRLRALAVVAAELSEARPGP